MKAIKENLIEFQSYFEQQHNDFYADMAKEALTQFQALESYIAEQVEVLQAKISTRTDSRGDRGKQEAYTDILQRIRGKK